MSILSIDVGTSGVRAAVVDADGSVGHVHHRSVRPTSPGPGLVELDPLRMADAVLDVASLSLSEAGSVEGVGVANQRASTILWDRATGAPVAPGIGWQDLRTVGTCLTLQAEGLRLAPNASATKLAALLDMADPDRRRDLCFGTVDTWVAWTLSEGGVHVTDATNAAATDMVSEDEVGLTWSPKVLQALNIPGTLLPDIVDSSGPIGAASALPGSPPITGIAGDQQASLIGQGCTLKGLAKATFGTGAMLDQCVGSDRPAFSRRGGHGTFPIVAWQLEGSPAWGIEAVMLSAGSAVDWLAEDLGLISSPGETDELAASCRESGDVWFVPALLGMGTPVWDFGARGTLLGLTRGAGKPEIVRAVLEGVAHRGADLLEAAEGDSGLAVERLRVDGGMTDNRSFLQALADACRRPVEVSPVLEATTLGAAYLAGLSLGMWTGPEDLAAMWRPRSVFEPKATLDRDRWREARERALRTVPELSDLDFWRTRSSSGRRELRLDDGQAHVDDLVRTGGGSDRKALAASEQEHARGDAREPHDPQSQPRGVRGEVLSEDDGPDRNEVSTRYDVGDRDQNGDPTALQSCLKGEQTEDRERYEQVRVGRRHHLGHSSKEAVPFDHR